jgi:hypothetical protein
VQLNHVSIDHGKPAHPGTRGELGLGAAQRAAAENEQPAPREPLLAGRANDLEGDLTGVAVSRQRRRLQVFRHR